MVSVESKAAVVTPRQNDMAVVQREEVMADNEVEGEKQGYD